MSYSTMICFNADGSHGGRVEFRNAWGLHARIWSAMQRHLGWREADWLMRVSRDGDKCLLWEMHKDVQIPADDRIVHALTYDRVWIPAALIPRVAAALRSFAERHPADGVCHLEQVAIEMERAALSDLAGVGFWGTSVAENPWTEWDEERDEGSELSPLIVGTSIADVVPDLFDADTITPKNLHSSEDK